MKKPRRTLTIALFFLALLGLGALAVGSSALGFIYEETSPRVPSLVRRGWGGFRNLEQSGYSDPLITLVKPSAPLREDTPFAPTVLATDPVLPAISSPVERGEMQEGGVEPVNIVLFCDHVAEACQQAVRVARQFVGATGRSPLRLTWKAFPNPLDPASRPAALAARCAQKQGKFWEFHEALTPSISPLLRGRGSGGLDYGILASELGLDLEIFNRCVETRATADLVNQGMDEAQALDIDGIPALFINSYRLTGEITVDKIERLVELEFKSQFPNSNVK